MAETLDQQICRLIRATDESLWNTFQCAIDGKVPDVGKLVFPRTSKNEVRVSEQEARQLLIANLTETDLVYSIETPTLGNYSFGGKGKRNAMTDLTLYPLGKAPCLNMEFKSGNTTKRRRDRKHIAKDIVKLVWENVDGFWFHILEATNQRSISELWNTFRQELKAVVQDAQGKFAPKQLTFHCCVLKQTFSVQTTLRLDERSYSPDWLDDFHPPSFRVKKDRLCELQKPDGWTVKRQSVK